MLLSTAVYLPKDWIEDMEHRKAAGIPDGAPFATKLRIGIAIVASALDARVPCAWVLGGPVDGSGKSLRVMLAAMTSRMFSPFVAMRDW